MGGLVRFCFTVYIVYCVLCVCSFVWCVDVCLCACARVCYMYACACTFARARVSMCAAFMRVYIWQCMYTYVYICVSMCRHKSAFRQYPSRALLGNDQLSICDAQLAQEYHGARREIVRCRKRFVAVKLCRCVAVQPKHGTHTRAPQSAAGC